MKMLRRLPGSCFAVLLLAISAAAAGDETPTWLQQAAKVQAPTYNQDVPAVVLQKEHHVTVGEDGRVTTITTGAVRVLVSEGRGYAVAREFYQSDGGKVSEIRAWLIRPSGEVKKYGKDDVVDAIENPDDIYNESRFKVIDGSDDADVGCVFGYQTTKEERSIFSQDVWGFQNRLPTLVSRYTLTLPLGWSSRSVTFNHAAIEPVVNGSNYSWEMRNLPPI